MLDFSFTPHKKDYPAGSSPFGVYVFIAAPVPRRGARSESLTNGACRQLRMKETQALKVLCSKNLTLEKYHDSKNRIFNGAFFARI
jgi:hypothetical protein